jgi:hypothetical protein
MVQRGEYFGLALETGDAIGVSGKGGWKDLDRDVALQARVAGSIHLAHLPCPEHGFDFVDAEASTSFERQRR